MISLRDKIIPVAAILAGLIETPEFLEIAQRMRDGLGAGHDYED